MKREIKFRGKRLDNGEWVYGDYYKKSILTGSGQHIIVHYIGYQVFDEVAVWNECQKVDPDTIGLYTGIKTKDCKEIYEGDIIELNFYSCDLTILTVTFKNGCFCLDGDSEILIDQYKDKIVSIVGNIYEKEDIEEGIKYKIDMGYFLFDTLKIRLKYMCEQARDMYRSHWVQSKILSRGR